MKEILPIVDENDKIIDEIDKAEFDKTTGRIYRTVSLILFNLDGDFLIQRRSFSKATFAGKWQNSAAAGHVQIGESYLDAIHRETIEEIGLNLRFQDFIKVVADLIAACHTNNTIVICSGPTNNRCNHFIAKFNLSIFCLNFYCHTNTSLKCIKVSV